MLHDAIGFDSSSIVLLLSIVWAIRYGSSFPLLWRISYYIPELGKLISVHVCWAAWVWPFLIGLCSCWRWNFNPFLLGRDRSKYFRYLSPELVRPILLLNWGPPQVVWRSDWHGLLVNLEFLHADVQSFKRFDRNCAAKLVTGMAAFNSRTVFLSGTSSPGPCICRYWVQRIAIAAPFNF